MNLFYLNKNYFLSKTQKVSHFFKNVENEPEPVEIELAVEIEPAVLISRISKILSRVSYLLVYHTQTR